jgi:hypothetical protein
MFVVHEVDFVYKDYAKMHGQQNIKFAQDGN